MKPITLILSGLSFMLCSCAPINTEFSCNKVAGDRCLTIEEVNAMTESKAGLAQVSPALEKHRQSQHQRAASQTIWLAPWVDEHGVRHSFDVMTSKVSDKTKRGHHVG